MLCRSPRVRGTPIVLCLPTAETVPGAPCRGSFFVRGGVDKPTLVSLAGILEKVYKKRRFLLYNTGRTSVARCRIMRYNKDG